ncbi:MAG: hypothetical protein GXP25_10530 [Planctomycetes bacterium]|nr:hypothetical protein [Planctomycetota bacterium]
MSEADYDEALYRIIFKALLRRSSSVLRTDCWLGPPQSTVKRPGSRRGPRISIPRVPWIARSDDIDPGTQRTG